MLGCLGDNTSSQFSTSCFTLTSLKSNVNLRAERRNPNISDRAAPYCIVPYLTVHHYILLLVQPSYAGMILASHYARRRYHPDPGGTFYRSMSPYALAWNRLKSQQPSHHCFPRILFASASPGSCQCRPFERQYGYWLTSGRQWLSGTGNQQEATARSSIS